MYWYLMFLGVSSRKHESSTRTRACAPIIRLGRKVTASKAVPSGDRNELASVPGQRSIPTRDPSGDVPVVGRRSTVCYTGRYTRREPGAPAPLIPSRHDLLIVSPRVTSLDASGL